jgi:YVTN family beta-propeller protein
VTVTLDGKTVFVTDYGSGTVWAIDVRTRTKYADIPVSTARPRHFILENVYALTYRNRASRPAFQQLLREPPRGVSRICVTVRISTTLTLSLESSARRRTDTSGCSEGSRPTA